MSLSEIQNTFAPEIRQMEHFSEGLRFAYLLTEKSLKENTQNMALFLKELLPL